MATSPLFRRRRVAFRAVIAALIAVGLYFVPPFRIVPLTAARQKTADAAFDASAFVERFWSERLLPSAARAVDAAELRAAIERDPAAARARHGRSLGLSNSFQYFVRGTGRVVKVQGNSIHIALGEGETADVVIDAGPVFGNAIRDGTGLLDVSDFPNSQDFNAISSEINQRVEERVLPALRAGAAAGVRVRFVGCVEMLDESAGAGPLRVVPFIAEVLP